MAFRVLILGLFGLLTVACAERRESVSLEFRAQYGDQALSCDNSTAVQLTDLRFYVHGLSVRDATGRDYPLEMIDAPPWQANGLALVDLEDASGGCENGTADTNASIRVRAPAAEWRWLEFTVGVPFDRNHGDPLIAIPPLGDPAMHWHWRGGYKFLRAGYRSVDDGYWIHLGSTGCVGTIRNITHCTAPNRVTVRLADFDPQNDSILIDLAELVDEVRANDSLAGDCSSGPAETDCTTAFGALGLAFATQESPPTQRVFRRGPQR